MISSVDEKSLISKLPQITKYYAEDLLIQAQLKGRQLSDSITGVLNDIYKAMQAKDKATIIERAQRLEELSAQVDDGSIAKMLKDRAIDLQKNAGDYVRMDEAIPTSDAGKITKAVEATHEAVKQTYNELVKETRPLTESDITIPETERAGTKGLQEGARKYKAGEVQPSEGTVEYKPLNPEQQALLDQINKDTLRLNELQNVQGGEFEASQVVNRLNKNMAELAKLRGKENNAVSFNDALNARLRDLGYTPQEIARMGDMDKLEIVASGQKASISGEELNRLVKEGKLDVYGAEQIKAVLSENGKAILAKLQNRYEQLRNSEGKPSSPESLAKEEQLRQEIRDLTEQLANELRGGSPIGGEKPTEKPPERGGGIATKEKVEAKPETKPMSDEEIKRLMTEKEKQAKPEAKPEPKTEAKPETKAKPETTTETERPVKAPNPSQDGSPYQGLVWENGRIFVKTIVPIAIPEGFGITEDDARAFPLTKNVPMTIIPNKIRETTKVATEVMTAAEASSPRYFGQPSIRAVGALSSQTNKQPQEQPSSAARQATTATELGRPMPTPRPVPVPTSYPYPQPTPQPQPEPKRPPERPPTKPPPKPPPPPPFIVVPSTRRNVKYADIQVIPGAISYKQGLMWKYIPPPYKKVINLRNPPPGQYRFADGEGSAYKTLQIIGEPPKGRIPPIDLGWAVVQIVVKNGIPTIEYLQGENANTGANVARFQREREREAVKQSHMIYPPDILPRYRRKPKARVIRANEFIQGVR
jgi:hypothetical protein